MQCKFSEVQIRGTMLNVEIVICLSIFFLLL